MYFKEIYKTKGRYLGGRAARSPSLEAQQAPRSCRGEKIENEKIFDISKLAGANIGFRKGGVLKRGPLVRLAPKTARNLIFTHVTSICIHILGEKTIQDMAGTEGGGSSQVLPLQTGWTGTVLSTLKRGVGHN